MLGVALRWTTSPPGGGGGVEILLVTAIETTSSSGRHLDCKQTLPFIPDIVISQIKYLNKRVCSVQLSFCPFP